MLSSVFTKQFSSSSALSLLSLNILKAICVTLAPDPFAVPSVANAASVAAISRIKTRKKELKTKSKSSSVIHLAARLSEQ